LRLILAQRSRCERQRRHVEQEHVFDVALSTRALDGRRPRRRLRPGSRPDAAVCDERVRDSTTLGMRSCRRRARVSVNLGHVKRRPSTRLSPADGCASKNLSQSCSISRGQLHRMCFGRCVRRDERQVDVVLPARELRALGPFRLSLMRWSASGCLRQIPPDSFGFVENPIHHWLSQSSPPRCVVAVGRP